jgi:hypothetical protein
MDKQRSTKHTYKTKDRVTRTPLKTGGELRCSGRVSSSCSTSDTRRVNLVTNLVISHTRRVSGISFIMYAHSLKIGKSQSLKVFGASKPMVVDKTAVLIYTLFSSFVIFYHFKRKCRTISNLMHQVMGAFNGIKRHVNKTCDIHMRD